MHVHCYCFIQGNIKKVLHNHSTDQADQSQEQSSRQLDETHHQTQAEITTESNASHSHGQQGKFPMCCMLVFCFVLLTHAVQ